MLNSGMAGWFAVSRLIFEHHVVGAAQAVTPAAPGRGAYSKMEAWLWLIANASYEPRTVMNKGREVSLQVGELMGATSYLADTWNWTPETVRWFVKRLETTLMITRFCDQQRSKHTNQCQILSICNYGHYQVGKDAQPQAHPNRTPSEPQPHPNRTPSAPQESNKYTSEQEESPPTPRERGESSVDFERFWTAFPGSAPPKGRKTDKAKARETFERIVTGRHRKLPKVAAEVLVAAAERYAASAPDPDYIPMPTTWLNGARWEDAAGAQPAGLWWKDPARVAEVTAERWRSGIAQHANGTWPIDKLGPPPGHKQCVVPPDIIAELHLTERYDERGISRRLEEDHR